MTPRQFRAALDRLALSQADAAQLVGMTPRSSRRWIAGERSIPEPVAIILRLMLAGKITADDINTVRK